MDRTLHPAALTAIGWLLLLVATRPILSFVRIGVITDGSTLHTLLVLLSSAVFLFAVPLLILKKTSPTGTPIFFQRPQHLRTQKQLLCTGAIIFPLSLILLAQIPGFAEYYRAPSSPHLLLFATAYGVTYYMIEEFFFRRFLLEELHHHTKEWAIWITTVIFTLFHIGKPLPETIFAFFLGLYLCVLTIRTKSWIPAALFHFFIALFFAIFVFFFK